MGWGWYLPQLTLPLNHIGIAFTFATKLVKEINLSKSLELRKPVSIERPRVAIREAPYYIKWCNLVALEKELSNGAIWLH